MRKITERKDYHVPVAQRMTKYYLLTHAHTVCLYAVATTFPKFLPPNSISDVPKPKSRDFICTWPDLAV